jgi:hypothetical protein
VAATRAITAPTCAAPSTAIRRTRGGHDDASLVMELGCRPRRRAPTRRRRTSTRSGSWKIDAWAGEPCLGRGQPSSPLYELFFSNGGGIALEHCAVTDDGRSCALEYNVVGWGRAALPPEAELAVYVRGSTGKLAGARIYDDADPPLISE